MHSKIRGFCLLSMFALALPSGASAVPLDILVSKLTEPAGRISIDVTGPSPTGTFNRDTVFDFADGLHTVALRGAQATYGTFTLNGGAVVSTTGACVHVPGSPDAIDFDRAQLAEVRIFGSALSVPASLSTISLPETAGTFFGDGTVFLPPSDDPVGDPFTVTDRGGTGIFGAFSIDGSLVAGVVGGVPDSAESLVITAVSPGLGGTTSEMTFDTSRLGEVRLLISALSSPDPGRILVGIAETVGATSSDLLTYLPPNRLPSALPYRVTPRGGEGVYGTFVINPDLTVVPNPDGSLRTTSDGLAFDADVLNQLLVEPAVGNQVAIAETSGFTSTPQILILPNGTYRALLRNDVDTVDATLVLGGSPESSVLPVTSRATFTLLDGGPSDSDGDGISDEDDNCPNSDLSEIVFIGTIDTGVGNVVQGDGCSLADSVDEIAASTNDRGQFIVQVFLLSARLVQQGIITHFEGIRLVIAAVLSGLP